MYGGGGKVKMVYHRWILLQEVIGESESSLPHEFYWIPKAPRFAFL